jgi:hypothetical protein
VGLNHRWPAFHSHSIPLSAGGQQAHHPGDTLPGHESRWEHLLSGSVTMAFSQGHSKTSPPTQKKGGTKTRKVLHLHAKTWTEVKKKKGSHLWRIFFTWPNLDRVYTNPTHKDMEMEQSNNSSQTFSHWVTTINSY